MGLKQSQNGTSSQLTPALVLSAPGEATPLRFSLFNQIAMPLPNMTSTHH